MAPIGAVIVQGFIAAADSMIKPSGKLAVVTPEYSKEVGEFDVDRYFQALKNFRDTINENDEALTIA